MVKKKIKKISAVVLTAFFVVFFASAASFALTIDEAMKLAIADAFGASNGKLSAKTKQDYARLVFEAANRFGEEPFVIAALIIVESTVNAKARSNGNYGLMQIRWKVHKKYISKKFPIIKTEKDLLKPRENIIAGTELFSRIRGGGDVESAIQKYTGGGKIFEKVLNLASDIETRYYHLLSKSRKK